MASAGLAVLRWLHVQGRFHNVSGRKLVAFAGMEGDALFLNLSNCKLSSFMRKC